MNFLTPERLIDALIDARRTGNNAAVMDMYEDLAIIVFQPGVQRLGKIALAEWLKHFTALAPTFRVIKRHVIECGDVALHLSKWQLTKLDSNGAEHHVEGHTSDVLRKQPNGSWLVAIDNPWGAEVLAGSAQN